MTRRLVYIAAPYHDPDPAVVAWNVARASLLGRLAHACGYAPVVVHPAIAAGVYGDDSDPAQRAAGMEAAIAVLRGVQRAGGTLWALRRDDGTLSAGTAMECARAIEAHDVPPVRTWTEWSFMVTTHAPDLLPAWDALAGRPDAVGEVSRG